MSRLRIPGLGDRQCLAHNGKRLLVLACGGQGVGPFAQGLADKALVAELSSQLSGAAVRLEGGFILPERDLCAGQGEKRVDRCLDVARTIRDVQRLPGVCRRPVCSTAGQRDASLRVDDVREQPIVPQLLEPPAG